MHVPRLRALITCAALLFPFVLSANAEPTTLRALVDQAWQRSPASRALLARRAEVSAVRDLSASWIAGQPVLGLAQRDGRWTGQGAVRESEVSFSAPVWTPGQRNARRHVAQLSSMQLEAELRKMRLELAGEVRTRLWDVAAAQAQLQEQEGQLRNAQDLAAQVRRRVTVGDLARADGLLADQEAMAVIVAVAQAKTQTHAALSRLQVLTGPSGTLPLVPEMLAIKTDDNPRTDAARATQQHAQAALALARASRREPPAISLSMRQERSGVLSGPERTFGVAVQVPLGSASRNRPAEAQAESALTLASAELEQTDIVTQAERDVANTALVHARAALEAATARVAAMTEHGQLTEKAFRLGERGLADVLRSRALIHESRVAQRQQEVAVGRAHAQVNQASGVLP